MRYSLNNKSPKPKGWSAYVNRGGAYCRIFFVRIDVDKWTGSLSSSCFIYCSVSENLGQLRLITRGLSNLYH